MRLPSLILSAVMAINAIPFTSTDADGKQGISQETDAYSFSQAFSPQLSTKTSDFKTLVQSGDTYVDKTLLIKAIIENNDEALLITRPRRWGKTLNMSMLKYFFMPEMNEEGQRVFGENRKNTKLFRPRNIGDGYIDTREILKRLLLGQCVERCFAYDDEERIFDILEGIDFQGKECLLKSYKGKTLKDKGTLKEAVAKYGSTLASQFHGIENLFSP